MLRMIQSDRILLESDYCSLGKLDAQVDPFFNPLIHRETNFSFSSFRRADDGNF